MRHQLTLMINEVTALKKCVHLGITSILHAITASTTSYLTLVGIDSRVTSKQKGSVDSVSTYEYQVTAGGSNLNLNSGSAEAKFASVPSESVQSWNLRCRVHSQGNHDDQLSLPRIPLLYDSCYSDYQLSLSKISVLPVFTQALQ